MPHSEIHGSRGIRTSPWLIAAYHVLHRLCMPRHPPIALKTLDRSHCRCPSGQRSPPETGTFEKTSFSRSVRWPRSGRPIRCRSLSRCGDEPDPSAPGRLFMEGYGPSKASQAPDQGARTNLLFTMSCRTGRRRQAPRQDVFPVNDEPTPGGAGRDRTDDPLLAKQVLSQLSYTPDRNRGGSGWVRTSDPRLIKTVL